MLVSAPPIGVIRDARAKRQSILSAASGLDPERFPDSLPFGSRCRLRLPYWRVWYRGNERIEGHFHPVFPASGTASLGLQITKYPHPLGKTRCPRYHVPPTLHCLRAHTGTEAKTGRWSACLTPCLWGNTQRTITHPR